MASKTVLKEEELSCPVCYTVYVDPLVLSCSHSFCKACLEKWWTKSPLRECPVCKTSCSNDNPPRNLALKNLCDAFLQERAQGASVVSEEVCRLHSERLQLLCLYHQQLVCVVCRDSEEHANHSFKPINEVAHCRKAEVLKSLEPLKMNLIFLQEDREDWVKAAEEVKIQAQKTEIHIHEDFEKLQEVLQMELEARICALRKEERNKSQMMKDKIEDLNREIEDVSDFIRDVEKHLEAPDVSFLQNYKSTMEKFQRPPHQELQWPSGALRDMTKYMETLKITSLVELIKHLLRITETPRDVEKHLESLDVSFLKNYKSTMERAKLSLTQEPQWPSGALRDLTNHMTALTLTFQIDQIEHHLRSTLTASVEHGGVSMLTSDLRKYACKLTLDPNTPYRKLILSEDNRKTSYGIRQSYPDHSERFDYWEQVLGRESLTGRCYWEVDWEGWVSIGVTYKGISRKGNSDDSCLGCNDKSWVLECSGKGYTARHNSISKPISLSSSLCVSCKVGVYLDWPAGSLSFYTVSSDTLTHIHTFYCNFTEGLLPAFRVVWGWTTSSVTLGPQ